MPRIDLPPDARAAAHFPPDFGRRFAIFADAEEEFDWNAPFDRAAIATTAFSALPEANARFAARGIAPVYMVDWPVVDTPASADVLRALAAEGACEIGTQLHPWVTPPHEEAVNARNSFAGSLPSSLEYAKLARLTERLIAEFGTRPIAYRAGRYGVGPATAEHLVALGYDLDVSVRALYEYRAQGGPDFTRHPVPPYWIAPGLLEVPLSAVLLGPLRRLGRVPSDARARGTLARTRLLDRVALTPEGIPLAAALAGIRRMLADGARLFSLSFHTPSLVPGHTPYVRDAADLAAFWRWWDAVLDLFAREGVTPVRTREIVAAAHGLQGGASLR